MNQGEGSVSFQEATDGAGREMLASEWLAEQEGGGLGAATPGSQAFQWCPCLVDEKLPGVLGDCLVFQGTLCSPRSGTV